MRIRRRAVHPTSGTGLPVSLLEFCPFSVRELLPTAAKANRQRGGIRQYFLGLDWLELFCVASGFPLLTEGL
jgi:hypothetical protein